jgi:hypothetical protein
LKRLNFYTFLDNQAAILRKVAMLGLCTALTVSTTAPLLYPGGGGGKMELNCCALLKILKITKKFTKYTKCANVAQQYPHPVRRGVPPKLGLAKVDRCLPSRKKIKKVGYINPKN